MIETKRCSKCGETKPLDCFRVKRRSEDGRQTYCKGCANILSAEWRRNNQEKVRGQQRARRSKNPEHFAAIDRKKDQKKRAARYGLSLVNRAELLRLQSCRCAICYDQLKPGAGGHAIDHDHHTGMLRGVLCAHCNRGLGAFRDRPDILLEAIAYLKRHKKA